jgi:DNA mismatch endonuclease, patch repair protein
MTDVFDEKTRSFVMSQIKSKDTTPEILLRRELWEKGYRYRKHHKDAHNADIAFPGKKLAIFIDGDFWHGYNWIELGKVPPAGFWQKKIKRNIERDQRYTKELEGDGWTVFRFWEHEVNNDLGKCIEKIEYAYLLQKDL